MKFQKYMESLNQHSGRLWLVCVLAMALPIMVGCAAKRTVSNSQSVSTTQVAAPVPDADPIEEDSEPTEIKQPQKTFITSSAEVGSDWRTAPCANGQPRKPKTGNCPEMPLCPKRCSWSVVTIKGVRQSCWPLQGQNVVVGYSDQLTPDGKMCAWVKEP